MKDLLFDELSEKTVSIRRSLFVICYRQGVDPIRPEVSTIYIDNQLCHRDLPFVCDGLSVTNTLLVEMQDLGNSSASILCFGSVTACEAKCRTENDKPVA